MAFDLARYNLQPYNTAGAKTRKVSVSIIETVSASVGTASMISPLAIINERVNNVTSGELTRKIKPRVISESIAELVVEALASVIVNLAFNEIVETASDICANNSIAIGMNENIQTESEINSEISLLSRSIEESIATNINLGAVISTETDIYELVDETTSVDALEVKICNIGTTADRFVLKPGQRVIINASDYNVLLDGENAIWYQNGDWVDDLNRDTISIAVTAASGLANLTVTILYTERYL